MEGDFLGEVMTQIDGIFLGIGALFAACFCTCLLVLDEYEKRTRKKKGDIMKEKLAYIAGAYSADSIDGVKRNIKLGMDLAARVVRDLNVSVYAPWTDWDFYVHYDLSVDQMKKSSMAILERSDLVIIQPVGCHSS